MRQFADDKEIYAFLKENKEAIAEANNAEAVKYLLPIFASPVTNDPKVMMAIYKYIDLETEAHLGCVARENIKELKDVDLSLYKFKILCEYRGPLNEEDFLDATVREKPQDEYVMEAAKHKDFPVDGREIMYAIHKTVDYVSPEAQEMFIF